MRAWVVFLLLAWGQAGGAVERVSVCYNYSCLGEAEVAYGDGQLLEIDRLMQLADSDEGERALLSQAIGRLYRWAGEQSAVGKDRGGNYADDEVHGRMDCIDHSTTTTRFLRMMEGRGWLRWHRVLEPVRRTRFLFGQHFAAAIETLEDTEGGGRFAVDSWFMDNGEPAVILPLESWLRGDGPDVE